VRPAGLDDEVGPGIGKRIRIPWNKKVVGFYNLTVDVDDVESLHRIIDCNDW